MFSTITSKNEKKPHQKSQEEHQRIFLFSFKTLLTTKKGFFGGFFSWFFWFVGVFWFFFKEKKLSFPSFTAV